jgi:hypothetical protein
VEAARGHAIVEFLNTYSPSWSVQGLRYYKAETWCRMTVGVNERLRGRPIRLWLGGSDESAKAWINGTSLKLIGRGTAPNGWPWEFDATGSIRFNQPNVIVVKVSNRCLIEVDTGGITDPAMLWARRQ